jgi:hypothetical protein
LQKVNFLVLLVLQLKDHILILKEGMQKPKVRQHMLRDIIRLLRAKLLMQKDMVFCLIPTPADLAGRKPQSMIRI